MAYSNTSNSKMKKSNHGLIICGTDTDIGKTVISSLFLQGLNGFYWKPIQSGMEDGSDTNYISKLLKLGKEHYLPEVYKFQAPVSPHWAAEKENQCIDPKKLSLPSKKYPLVVETAGGLMVPINRTTLQIDQIKLWQLPVLLVARSGLGTLNHTLLSIEALKRKDIPIRGIILNGQLHQDNPKTIEDFSGIPVLAEIPNLKKITAEALSAQWEEQQLDIKFKDLIHK